jgi:hypothetical protein
MSVASPPTASRATRTHRASRLDPALSDFYGRHPRRARSRERDVGLRWRARDHSTYRAAWIADTGELYSVRHGALTEADRVTVLARLDAQALERALDGWRQVCDTGEPGSYEWLVERARDAGSASRTERLPAAA